jgi:hypothetical protein
MKRLFYISNAGISVNAKMGNVPNIYPPLKPITLPFPHRTGKNLQHRCCNFTGVGLDSSSLGILRMNPEYWKRNLPISAIRFLDFKWLPGKAANPPASDSHASGYCEHSMQESSMRDI